MHRLTFEEYHFEFLKGGREGFKLAPVIVDHFVEFGTNLEVEILYRRERFKPSTIPGGSYVVLYALAYGSTVKLGTSTISGVVERMYSQAPRVGMVLGVYATTFDMEREHVENLIANKLSSIGGFTLSTKKPGMDEILMSRRSTGRHALTVLLDLANRVAEMKIEGLKGPLFPPGEYWFTTPSPPEKPNANTVRQCGKLLEDNCKSRKCRGVLRVDEDCICTLELRTNEGKSTACVTICDWIKWNLVFYSVRV